MPPVILVWPLEKNILALFGFIRPDLAPSTVVPDRLRLFIISCLSHSPVAARSARIRPPAPSPGGEGRGEGGLNSPNRVPPSAFGWFPWRFPLAFLTLWVPALRRHVRTSAFRIPMVCIAGQFVSRIFGNVNQFFEGPAWRGRSSLFFQRQPPSH